MCKPYNGYTNYETWCIGLWIDNDESTQAYIMELAEQADSVYELEQAIKDYVDENNPLADGASMYTDLLNSAIENFAMHQRHDAWLLKENSCVSTKLVGGSCMRLHRKSKMIQYLQSPMEASIKCQSNIN